MKKNDIEYFDSEILGKKGKLERKTGIITIQDKKLFGERGYVSYSAEEVQIIKETTGEIDPLVHRVKNIFDGQIVRGEKS